MRSEASGYSNINANPGANPNYRQVNPKSLENRVVLGGVGLQYKVSENTNIYANYSQAFRPVLFSDLYTIGTTLNDIDPNLKINLDTMQIQAIEGKSRITSTLMWVYFNFVTTTEWTQSQELHA